MGQVNQGVIDKHVKQALLSLFSLKLAFMLKSKVVFLIPKTDNKGKLFSWKLFYWLVTTLLELAGGYNVEQISGGWINSEGLIQHEECFKFTVGIEEMKIPTLLSLLQKAKQVFNQEALYVEIFGKILIL